MEDPRLRADRLRRLAAMTPGEAAAYRARVQRRAQEASAALVAAQKAAQEAEAARRILRERDRQQAELSEREAAEEAARKQAEAAQEADDVQIQNEVAAAEAGQVPPAAKSRTTTKKQRPAKKPRRN